MDQLTRVDHPAKTPWRTVAIVLAVLLGIALVGMALIVTGVTNLGLSLM